MADRDEPAFDVIVLGTGAAGLTAAIAAHEGGARVGVFEKADTVGGTSAWSGGQIWIPNNRHERAAGREDSREKALTYIMSLSHGMIDPAMAAAYVDTGPEMMDFLEQRTPVEFYAIPEFPDYHPEAPGGMAEGGRTLECPPFPYGELGAWKDRVGTLAILSRFHDHHRRDDARQIGADARFPRGEGAAPAERRARHGAGAYRAAAEGMPRSRDRAAHRLPRRRTGDRGRRRRRRPLRGRRWAVHRSRRGGDPRHRRVRMEPGADPRLHPRAADASGVDQDEHRRWPEDGDARGCDAGQHARGVVDAGDRGADRDQRDGRATAHLRAHDAGIADGEPPRPPLHQRGVNYNAFGAAFHEQDVSRFEYANLPCWLIFNQDFYAKWPFVGGLSDEFAGAAEPPQWIPRADTLAALARRVGIDPAGLEESVATFNGHCDAGSDPDFRRGESANDLWWGDPAHRGSKRATLGALGDGPYYAIEVKSGALGTKGGPQTDVDARVLDVDGRAIPGLYAAGNVMASPMGMTYGGAGGTLGPGMVFGYRAGRDAAARAGANSRQEELAT